MYRKILASGFVLWRWHFLRKRFSRPREALFLTRAKWNCRFEKRERSNVPDDRSFQLGEGTSENVWDARKFRGKLWQLFSVVDVNAERRFVTISGVPDEFQPGEGTGGGRRIMLSSWIAAPPCAANSRRLNCLPDGVTCRYAAYTSDELATSICTMKNLSGAARSAKRS